MEQPPVVIVDEDVVDVEIIKEVWRKLRFEQPLVFLKNANELIAYLHSGNPLPLVIVSDIQLPKISGFELKQSLMRNETTDINSIPFVFMSGSASEATTKKAYELCSHGFFIKDKSFDAIKDSFRDIVLYWSKSRVPEKQHK
jgi:CheY-like chemotaxis protein